MNLPDYKVIGYFAFCACLSIFGQVERARAQIITATKVWNEQNISDLVVGDSFIGVGQQDLRPWLNPQNGVALTTKPKTSWPAPNQNQQLNQRQITQLTFSGNKLYAATYNNHLNSSGIFVSNDNGETFTQTGPNITATSVAACSDIFAGSAGKGLWKISASNFKQVLGDGYYGPTIYAVSCNKNLVLTSTELSTFISIDYGETFDEIPRFKNLRINKLFIQGNIVVAGTSNYAGVYVSHDFGSTWEELVFAKTATLADVTSLRGTIYLLLAYPSQTRLVMGNGINWEIYILQPKANTPASLAVYFDGSPNLLYSSPDMGLYHALIPIPAPQKNQFMSLPWSLSEKTAFTDYITSFFDHEYPLLGYSGFSEPSETSTTIINFENVRGSSPNMYYSSHDGVDFKTAFGTEVLAVDSGLAEYYYCADCGQSIKVTHPNGYQSVYMHLQTTGLITDASTKVSVVKGQNLGKVGMIGNTTGPHIHLGVQKDLDFDGVFYDDYPNNKVDPFGWLDSLNPDPWEYFEWNDYRGFHQGTKSDYLWELDIPRLTKLNEETKNHLILSNKDVLIDALEPFSITIRPSLVNKGLGFIPSTSIAFEILNFAGEKVNELKYPAQLVISLAPEILNMYNPLTLKLYSFDVANQIWKSIPSVLDLIDHKISAEISSASEYAVFGVSNSNLSSYANIEGAHVVLALQETNTTNPPTLIYSKDSGSSWTQYLNPIPLSEIVENDFRFSATDSLGNIGVINSLVKIRKPFIDRVVFENVRVKIKE